jgi:hypothetical protein
MLFRRRRDRTNVNDLLLRRKRKMAQCQANDAGDDETRPAIDIGFMIMLQVNSEEE